MPTKKGSKTNTKKAAAAAVENLTFSVDPVSGAGLSTSVAEAAQFNGTVHYAGVAAVVITSEGARLLIMFKPSGNYTPADIGAAASHLRFVLGKQEGDPISVTGYAGNIFGKPCIFMISAI